MLLSPDRFSRLIRKRYMQAIQKFLTLKPPFNGSTRNKREQILYYIAISYIIR